METKPGSTARVKKLTNSKPKTQTQSWLSDARAFVRGADVLSHNFGRVCNLCALEVTGRAAVGLKTELVRSVV